MKSSAAAMSMSVLVVLVLLGLFQIQVEAGPTFKSKSAITYRIVYPKASNPVLSQTNLDSAIAWAFNTWTSNINLSVEKSTSGTADINISFEKIDGAGSTLSATENENIVFDIDENWGSADSPTEANFKRVALHDIGHALGLQHSRNPASMMSPFSSSSRENPRLPAGDIASIKELYGIQ